MRIFRALILMSCFCFDVHVKAEAILADGRKTLSEEGWSITMTGGSLLERRSKSVLELVDGRFYADVEEPVKLQTPYTKVWCEGECKGLFTRKLNQITIVGLEGRWRLTRTGDKTVYQVLAGTRVQVGEVSQEGSSDMEIPQSLPIDPTVKEWARLYPGKFAEFKEEVEHLRPLWLAAAESNSEMQQGQITRTLASVAKVERERQARLAAREREDAEMRRLFREKNP